MTERSNHRPILVLSVLSKILEKIMHKRLLSFFKNYKHFLAKQYVFLPSKSIGKDLLDQIGEIVQYIENSDYVATVYFDIAKAFDTVDHGISSCKS